MDKQAKPTYTFGPFRLKPAEWSLERGDIRIELPPKAFSVLLLLVERAGNLVLKEEILSSVWKDTFVEEANVAVHVAAIRRVLDEPPGTAYIETVKKKGYRFSGPVTVTTEPETAYSQAAVPALEAKDEIAETVPALAPPPVPRHRPLLWVGALLGSVAILLSFLAFRRDLPSGQAHDLLHQAQEQWKRRTPESVRQAIGMYEKAIELDPNFASAYAGLADCYNITNSGLPANVRYPLAKLNAEKAIALDPNSAEGHTSLAFMRYKLEWRWRDSDTEFKQAIALDPKYELAHHWYGEFLRLMGKTEEGISELKTAVNLEPESLATRTDLVAALIQGNHLQEARAEIDEGLKIDPSWSSFPFWMSEILSREGQEKESVEYLLRSMTLRGYPLTDVADLRTAYASGGMKAMLRAQAQQYLRQDQKVESAKVETATVLSFTYAQLGESDEAFHWLDIAIDHHQDAGIHLLTNKAYDPIRSDPRFDQLLNRLDLKNF